MTEGPGSKNSIAGSDAPLLPVSIIKLDHSLYKIKAVFRLCLLDLVCGKYILKVDVLYT